MSDLTKINITLLVMNAGLTAVAWWLSCRTQAICDQHVAKWQAILDHLYPDVEETDEGGRDGEP